MSSSGNLAKYPGLVEVMDLEGKSITSTLLNQHNP